MSTDESGAPWPYEDIPPGAADPDEPTWDCPGGECDCHAGKRDPKEPVPHKIHFFDHVTRPMPGARVRVLENGQLLNKDTPYADGDGAVEVKLKDTTRYLRVEWAPEDTPVEPRYPFRKLYHLDLGETQDQGVERRLHNLGFSTHSEFADNIIDFQTTYRKTATGHPEDIEADVVDYHDNAAIPPVPPGGSNKQALSKSDPGTDKLSLSDKHSLTGDGDSQKAKKAAPDTPKSGPGAAPGKATKGTVTGVATTKVRIELHIAFTLREEDFEKTDVEWKDMPYEPIKILDEIYPADALDPRKDKRDFRIGGKGSYPIGGATLTRVEPFEANEKQTTKKDGSVVFDLGDFLRLRPPGATSVGYFFDVEPPPDMLNTTGKPAGPALSDQITGAKYLFRKFSFSFEVDEKGALIPDKVKCHQPPGNPRHARLIRATNDPKKGGNVILIDWRPDWWRSGKETSRRPRHTDRVNVPKNPFDLSIPQAERDEACPPVINIHQTGTMNLPFFPGFVSDGNKAKTSIHYLVDLDGFVIKALDEHYRANHGGVSLWEQRHSLNEFAVGIETMHSDTTPHSPNPGQKFKITPRRYTKEQYDSFLRLLHEIETEYGVKRRRVRGHMEVLITRVYKKNPDGTFMLDAAGNKIKDHDEGTLDRERVNCPGAYFEWQRLEEATNSVALKPEKLPDKSPKTELDAVFAELPNLRALTEIKPSAKSPYAKLMKQLLFDIGYSVSTNLPAFADRKVDQPKMRAALSDTYDTPAQEAVRAFQTHHFSGRRRAYNILNTAAEKSLPRAGTLDAATIEAILQHWFAAMTQTK